MVRNIARSAHQTQTSRSTKCHFQRRWVRILRWPWSTLGRSEALDEARDCIAVWHRERDDDGLDVYKCQWKVSSCHWPSIFSVLTCCRLLPPYIVFAETHLWSAWICKNSFPGTRFNASPSGWVEEHVFFDWLSKHFIPFVAHTPKPVLLIFDGHKAHISTRITKLAMDHQVELLCLPPHSTTVLQPLDVVTLTKVKTAWRKLLVTHNTQTNSQKIDKRRFSYLVSKHSSESELFIYFSSRSEIYGAIIFFPVTVHPDFLAPEFTHMIHV